MKLFSIVPLSVSVEVMGAMWAAGKTEGPGGFTLGLLFIASCFSIKLELTRTRARQFSFRAII
jgi:hypothetical protein